MCAYQSSSKTSSTCEENQRLASNLGREPSLLEPKKSVIIRAKNFTPKTRFRVLIRKVIENASWLIDHEQMHNYKVFNKRRCLKSHLTLEDKILLNIPSQDRTEEENLIINRIIGNVKSFRKYPDNVKTSVAQYCYFRFHQADRIIVREGNPAEALYFIISGEANVIVEQYDEFLNEKATTAKRNLVAGDAFGEVSLLHDLPRTETIISMTPIEFIVLNKKNFDVVLKATVKAEWDFITNAMKSFTYFNDWDQIMIGECCIRASIVNYVRDQVIVGDGYGRKSSVHFILKGRCALIEHIYVEETVWRKKTSYKLHVPTVASKTMTKVTAVEQRPVSAEREEAILSKQASKLSQLRGLTNKLQHRDSRWQGSGGSMDTRSKTSKMNTATKSEALISKANMAERDEYDAETEEDGLSRNYILPSNCKVHFMQLCFFTEKASFCLGESMRRRRVVAMEPTQCLLIPRYWLKDKGTIWTCLRQYLAKSIPNTNAVFQQFVMQRTWRQYKEDVVQHHQQGALTCNSIHNVPYSIRIRSDYKFNSIIARTEKNVRFTP